MITNLIFGHVFRSRHHRPPGIARPREAVLGFFDHYFPSVVTYGEWVRVRVRVRVRV